MEKIDLTKILKDCPSGTELYSPICGTVVFERINEGEILPIETNKCVFTADGRLRLNGEQMLFPSKDQRDWSKWSVEPKFDIPTLQPFDKVLVRDSYDDWTISLFSYVDKTRKFGTFVCNGGVVWEQCVPYNEETKHLLGTSQQAPDKYITW